MLGPFTRGLINDVSVSVALVAWTPYMTWARRLGNHLLGVILGDSTKVFLTIYTAHSLFKSGSIGVFKGNISQV